MKTAVIVGAGHRSLCYASYAERHPDEIQNRRHCRTVTLR